jgi:hypothetical protein
MTKTITPTRLEALAAFTALNNANTSTEYFAAADNVREKTGIKLAAGSFRRRFRFDSEVMEAFNDASLSNEDIQDIIKNISYDQLMY